MINLYRAFLRLKLSSFYDCEIRFELGFLCNLLQSSQFWQPTNYSALGGRSKSSCSPDLGIESDAAVTTMRPLKDTLKITESMTNLLSDEDNDNHRAQDLNSESPLPIEGAF